MHAHVSAQGHLSVMLFVTPVCVISCVGPHAPGETGWTCQRPSFSAGLFGPRELGTPMRPGRCVSVTSCMVGLALRVGLRGACLAVCAWGHPGWGVFRCACVCLCMCRVSCLDPIRLSRPKVDFVSCPGPFCLNHFGKETIVTLPETVLTS